MIQAAISALHSTAPSWEATDWPQIAALYAELQRYDGSPVVAVNRAVAVGFADGPRAGLALLDAAAGDERLARYQPLHAARAELLTPAGEDADEAYARAIELTDNEAERAALSASSGQRAGMASAQHPQARRDVDRSRGSTRRAAGRS